MLKHLPAAPPDRFPVGTKTLSLDPAWTDPPVCDIEAALLRAVAFPESGRLAGLSHEFVILNPSNSAETPGHEDLALRIAAVAARMRVPTTVIGHDAGPAVGANGFPVSVHRLARMDGTAFPAGFATLREQVRRVVAGSRFSHRRHVLVPLCDAAMLAILVEVLAELKPAARPFVHIATRWTEAEMPNAARFGPLERFGKALHQLNGERPTTFVYAWSRRLARHLADELGQTVRPLEPPPELALSEEGESAPERFTVGWFGSGREDGALARIASVVRAANRASSSRRRVRFIVQVPPDAGAERHADAARAVLDELAAIPERNVTVIDVALTRPVFLAALRQVDAVLLPYGGDGRERFSLTAHHATAAGKLILTHEDVPLAWTVRSRVLTARDERVLGEVISDTAGDLAAVRAAARAAKATYWSTVRPSRLFAELLYGPMILGGASGAEFI